jgi:hypothetical protein
LQRALRAVFVLLCLVCRNIALALLRGHLCLDFDQRVLGLADAFVEFAHDLARVARRVLHGIGCVVQKTFERARNAVKKRHEKPPENGVGAEYPTRLTDSTATLRRCA